MTDEKTKPTGRFIDDVPPAGVRGETTHTGTRKHTLKSGSGKFSITEGPGGACPPLPPGEGLTDADLQAAIEASRAAVETREARAAEEARAAQLPGLLAEQERRAEAQRRRDYYHEIAPNLKPFLANLAGPAADIRARLLDVVAELEDLSMLYQATNRQVFAAGAQLRAAAIEAGVDPGPDWEAAQPEGGLQLIPHGLSDSMVGREIIELIRLPGKGAIYNDKAGLANFNTRTGAPGPVSLVLGDRNGR